MLYRSKTWLATLTSLGLCLGLGLWHWMLFNNMADAASAIQSFHALLHDGAMGRNSLEDTPVFGVHLWLLGLVGLPLFRILGSYPALVFTQSLVLSLSVPAAARIARSCGANRQGVERWTWLWAVSPLVLGPHAAWGEGWQPLTLAITPLMWAIAFGLERRSVAASLSLGLCLLAREDASLILLGYALWSWRALGTRRLSLLLALASVGWLASALVWIIPTISGHPWNIWGIAAPSLGTTPESITRGFAGNPLWLVHNVVQPWSIAYIAYVLMSVGKVGTSNRWALAACLPVVLVNVGIESSSTRIPFLPYSATLAPFLYLASLQLPGTQEGPLRRQRLVLCCSLLLLLGWHFRLTWNGLQGMSRSLMTCLERELPRNASLSLSNPRGASRFAWGQDLGWINEPLQDSRIESSSIVVLFFARKSGGLGWFQPDSLAGIASRLRSSGSRLVLERDGTQVWSRIPLNLHVCAEGR